MYPLPELIGGNTQLETSTRLDMAIGFLTGVPQAYLEYADRFGGQDLPVH